MVYVESQLPSPSHNREDSKAIWIASLAEGRTEEELTVIRRALEIAEQAHVSQTRASGEPYLTHAMAVADIVLGMRLDHESIAASILHDVVEDTSITIEQIAEQCGEGVAHLVDGVTKMNTISEYQVGQQGKKENLKAESLRKLLLAMAEDVRVVLIKLADRLHNMRTLKFLHEEKQRRIARETMDIYAPLANRLGIWQIKWELEDLSFRYLDPATYKQVARFLDERRVDRQGYIDKVIGVLQKELDEAGINADIKGRPKHIYSIWKKMKRKGLSFHDLFDVRAVRVLVDSVADCYHVLGTVHGLWPHIPKEFDDYIATPKENNYQSIHTAVVGPGGKTLEVQIRTWDMDKHAELGVAAHWRYKEGGGRHNKGFEQKIAWLRQLLVWKEEEANAGDFIDRFKSEVFQDRVYVLTPNGEVFDMPQGATPLDFAYYVHTEVGNRCRGAKVNGRIVPLTYELKSGEQVEVLTTRQGGPSRDWLNPHLGYLRTSRARSKARGWFKQQDQQRNLSDGRITLERELHRLGVADLGHERLYEVLHQGGVDDMLIAIGRGDITTAQIAGAVHKLTTPAVQDKEEALLQRKRAPSGADGDIQIRGVGNLLTNLARCCRPAPGDPIIGFITQGRGVTIHRSDCRNILNLPDEKRVRLIEVEWGGSGDSSTYPVEVEIEAVDRQGLLIDIYSVLANEKINILATNTLSDRKRHIARMDLTLEIRDIDQLSRILGRINQLPNVVEVRRKR